MNPFDSNPFECDCCHSEMKIIKKRKIEGKRYTIKNLQCPVCGYEKTIYAGGIRDEAEANQAIDKINKQYKKEERL